MEFFWTPRFLKGFGIPSLYNISTSDFYLFQEKIHCLNFSSSVRSSPIFITLSAHYIFSLNLPWIHSLLLVVDGEWCSQHEWESISVFVLDDLEKRFLNQLKLYQEPLSLLLVHPKGVVEEASRRT